MTPEQRAEAVVRAYYDASIAEDFGAMYAELTDDAAKTEEAKSTGVDGNIMVPSRRANSHS